MSRRRANDSLEEAEEPRLQFTSMIDVIFQLLLFFLVTIKFPTNEGLLKAFLPKESSEPSKAEQDETIADTYIQWGKSDGQIHLQVGMTDLGVLALNNKGQTDEQVVLEVADVSLSLENELTRRRKYLQDEGKGEPKVVIKAEETIPYKYVVYVLNVCGKLEIKDVWFGPAGRAPEQ